jgi:glycosyltransferase involved in cell wall biosynthesis
MASPFVSVVVPVYGGGEALDRCLASLARQSYPTERYEVVVVDNGSPVAPVLPDRGRLRVRLLVEPEPGSYRARNRGVRSASGDVLAFTDADCEAASDWLERGVAALGATSEIGLVAGRIELTFATDDDRSAAERYEQAYAFRQRHYVEAFRFGATANVFTRRDVFERVGPFDEALQSCGDREWGTRVHAAGWRVDYCDEAVVRHPARRTVAELRTKRLRVTAGLWRIELATRERPVLGSVRMALRILVPPVRSLARLRRECPELPVGAFPTVAALYVYLRWVESAERLRLVVGGRPRGWRRSDA